MQYFKSLMQSISTQFEKVPDTDKDWCKPVITGSYQLDAIQLHNYCLSQLLYKEAVLKAQGHLGFRTTEEHTSRNQHTGLYEKRHLDLAFLVDLIRLSLWMDLIRLSLWMDLIRLSLWVDLIRLSLWMDLIRLSLWMDLIRLSLWMDLIRLSFWKD